MLREVHAKTLRLPRATLWLTLLAAFMALAACGPSGAATFYVNATTGSDANPGTLAQPWASIQNGDTTGVLNPGDTVIVQAGTYNVTGLGVYLTARNGTAGNPITYKAEGPGVIVQGGVIGFTISTKYTDIEGFEVQNCTYGIEYYLATGGTARKNIIHDCLERGIAAVQSTSPTFAQNLCYNITSDGAFLAHIEGCAGTVTLYNNTIDGSNGGTGRAAVVVFAGTCNTLVKNNIFANSVYGVSHNQPSPATMTNTNNLYFNNQFDYLYRVSNGPGEFSANPQWTNPGAGNYTLQSTSTAINTGVNVALPFNGPLPDLGAFETNVLTLPGFVVGQVTDAGDSTPLKNAKVATLDGTTWSFTDDDGMYRTMVQPGHYTMRATRPSFAEATAEVDVTENAETTKNFALSRVPPKTYYVNAATGSDSNNGLTPSTAWLTIGHGDDLGILNPDDVVSIAAGTYPQATKDGLYLKNSAGESGHPITYVASGGAVVIDQAAHQSETGTIYGIHCETSYIKFDGFEIKNCQQGIYFGVEHPGNEVANCYIHDLTAASGDVIGIGAFLNSGVYAHNNVISNVTSPGNTAECFWLAETSKATIVNNVLSGSYRGIYQISPIPDADRIVVKNNIIVNTTRALSFQDSGNHNSHNLLFGNNTNYYGQATPGAREFGADPMLDGTFHLMSGSPAVNVGEDVGLPFNGPAPDLGAYETSATGVPGGVVGIVRANLTGTPPLPLAKVALPGDTVFGYAGLDGAYYLPLNAGSYTLEASAPGFVTASASGINVTSGNLTTKDWLLSKGAWNTYYVDGTNGNDLNDGLSPATAWQTIMFGDSDDRLVPGDTVIVMPGTYATTGLGNQQLLTSGAPLAPITYKAQGPGVIIDGGGTAFGWVLWNSYVDLDGFEINNCTYGVDAVNSYGHEIRNCTVKDFVNAGLYTYGSGNVVFRNNLITNSTQQGSGLYAESHTGFAAINNTVVGAKTGVNLVSGTGTATVKNNILQNNETGLTEAQTGPLDNSNNLFWGNTADYGAETPAGPNEFNANPMLDGAYKPTSGSPAVDAGTNVGLAFNGLAPDLGFFETSFSQTPASKSGIGELKALTDGTFITFTTAKVVTAATGTYTDGSLYIEDQYQAAGIRVQPGSGLTSVALGDAVTLTGSLGTDARGQRYINATAMTIVTPIGAVEPMLVSGRRASGLGLDITGLLMRIVGRVTFRASDGSYIYVDDGSGATDGSGKTGVRVALDGLQTPLGVSPVANDFVMVTGPAALTSAGGNTVRVIKPRSNSDITVF